MAKKVTVINAISESKHMQPQQRLKVCAYARVSTGSRAQAESYATQVEYYTEKIENNPLWEFAGVYADEGITGTKVNGRDDFKAMIAACEGGDIDLILTKSITRFARNTVECIQTVRHLKSIGVGIYFEKEGINTLTEASELMLSILASVAQGESEDFSGNNRWAIINRFENGTFIVGTPAYGYRKDEDGNLIKEIILRKRKIREKPDYTRVTEVVESCQMCWISNSMQHICNKYATQISMICIGHFQRNLGMSFLCAFLQAVQQSVNTLRGCLHLSKSIC